MVGLNDKEVVYMLGMTRERYDEISTPSSHHLTYRESTAITNLSIWLGSLMTILDPLFVREWLFLPSPEPDGRTPAAIIAAGETEPIDSYIERANDIRIEFAALI